MPQQKETLQQLGDLVCRSRPFTEYQIPRRTKDLLLSTHQKQIFYDPNVLLHEIVDAHLNQEVYQLRLRLGCTKMYSQ